MKSVKFLQITIVSAIVLIMGFLLAQPIKGLVNEDKGAATSSEETSSQFNLINVSEMSKREVKKELADEITSLEAQLDGASKDDKIVALQKIADRWDDLAKYAPQGFAYEEMAKLDPKFEYWLKSGDAFRKAYTNLQDTVLASALNKMAIANYQKAVDLDSSNLAAKTGLGAAIVTGTNNPMAGIAILQEVVSAEPKNIEANRTLGLFSMQSRQFDKAIDRFRTVIDQQPDVESYFYLATSYENIGMKNEAISAYQESKKLASDPSLSQFIDKKIDELSK